MVIVLGQSVASFDGGGPLTENPVYQDLGAPTNASKLNRTNLNLLWTLIGIFGSSI